MVIARATSLGTTEVKTEMEREKSVVVIQAMTWREWCRGVGSTAKARGHKQITAFGLAVPA